MEMLESEASMAMQLLNQLLNLHDGFSHDEWLRRCRTTMLQIFTPEDAFTILGGPGLDLENVSPLFLTLDNLYLCIEDLGSEQFILRKLCSEC
jgi:hypothetical protein